MLRLGLKLPFDRLVEGETAAPVKSVYLKLEYDKANRLVRVEGQTLGVDHLSQAAQYAGYGAQFEVRYSYDAEGTLVGRKETWLRAGAAMDDFGLRIGHSQGDGSEVRYMHDGRHVWADVWTDGKVVDRYVHGTGPDQLLARVRLAGGTDDTAMYYLTDRQGSVQVMVLADGGHRFKDVRYAGTQAVKPWGDSALQPVPLHDRERFGRGGPEARSRPW